LERNGDLGVNMSNRYPGGLITKNPPALNPALGNAANGVFTMEQYTQAVKAGTWPGFDPYFEYTTLLLHGNGTNGAQNNTFIDSSTNNFTITRNGNTTQGTFTPFSKPDGSWGNFFDGSGDALTIAKNSSLLPAGDFTIECWVYPLSLAGQVIGSHEAGTSANWILNIVNTGQLDIYIPTQDIFNAFKSTSTIAVNQWSHIVACRSGTTLYIGCNGSLTTHTNISGSLDFGANLPITIGADQFGDESNFTGYISNARIVNGTCLYSGSTYSVPASPLTAVTNTSLLTCQSNRFVDNSSNAFAITRNGDVRVTPFSPFPITTAYSTSVNGGAGYFDGTGDYLSIADNAAFAFGSGDFTIECWVYMTGAAQQFFVSQWSSPQRSWAFLVKNSGTTLSFVHSTTGSNEVQTDGSISAQANTWAHFAAVRNGNSLKTYMNGTQIGSRDVTGVTLYDASQAVEIGRNPEGTTTWNLTGYISNVRVVKGTAVYTAAFTPPTAPLTAISDTSLLCNFTNAGIFDNTGFNALETVGNAQIDTTTKKYGTGSMEFDGNGDWLLIPDSPDLKLGTGNFTIEFWVYLASGDTGSARGLVAKGGASTGWLVSLDSSQKVVFTYTTSTITSSGAITTNAWNHIAVVREGTGSNQTKIYIGGTNDGTGTVSTDFTQTEVMYIGANRTAGNPMKGFIDDLRVTKGIARYTANFTPQTSQWQDQ
jgi:hypothetical protein